MRLLDLKAQLIQPRVHEINFSYDLPDGSMRTNGRVLRLRQDANAILTYKGPSEIVDGVFCHAQNWKPQLVILKPPNVFLKALGYVQIMIYEKYRATYDLNGCHIMLDELYTVTSLKLKVQTHPTIRKVSSQLGLKF